MVRSYPLKMAGGGGAAVRFDLPATFVHPMFFTTTRAACTHYRNINLTLHSILTGFTVVAFHLTLRRDRRHGVQQLGQACKGSN
jgi:hypothetical protein